MLVGDWRLNLGGGFGRRWMEGRGVGEWGQGVKSGGGIGGGGKGALWHGYWRGCGWNVV